MPSLANLLENYRNWKGRQDWQSGKEMQDYFGGDPVAQEQFDRLSGFGTADLGGLSGLAGAIKASHGSPHAFEKFDFSKIGTGEGAQAYGHGGYFGQGFDSPVAKEYQKQLAADVQLKGQPFYSGKSGKQLATTGNPELDDYLMANLGDVGAARTNLLADLRDVRSGGGDVKDYQRTLADLRNIRGDVQNADLGHLYNVELKWPDAAREASDPLGEHHLLSWEESISKQPEHVKAAIQNINKELIPQLSAKEQKYAKQLNEDMPAAMWYQTLARTVKPESLSKALYEQNVPGLKYLDQGSRSAGEGTRNYVMFNDQFPEIVSRNGVSLSDLLRR